jgi:hypothetical protein
MRYVFATSDLFCSIRMPTPMRAFSLVFPADHTAGRGLGSNGRLHVGHSFFRCLQLRRHRLWNTCRTNDVGAGVAPGCVSRIASVVVSCTTCAACAETRCGSSCVPCKQMPHLHAAILSVSVIVAVASSSEMSADASPSFAFSFALALLGDATT